jgi:hypothetical protein
MDLTTVAKATFALRIADKALATISTQRAAFGAVQGRFEATISNLQATSENLSASRSRILDADFAQETANLTRAQILSEREWQQMPYIIADDENQVVYTNRDRVYARGALFDQPRYQVFRPGEALLDSGSGQPLGVAGLYLGVAVLERDEDPASFLLSEVIAPVRAGDRLLPVDEERELYSFEPHPVPPDTEGLIIAKLDPDVTQITQYSSVIVNLGAQEGMEPGHVLAIYGKPRTVVDPISGNDVQLPGERVGLLMLYKIHDLVSYGLVMQAERAIRMNDRVTTP